MPCCGLKKPNKVEDVPENTVVTNNSHNASHDHKNADRKSGKVAISRASLTAATSTTENTSGFQETIKATESNDTPGYILNHPKSDQSVLANNVTLQGSIPNTVSIQKVENPETIPNKNSHDETRTVSRLGSLPLVTGGDSEKKTIDVEHSRSTTASPIVNDVRALNVSTNKESAGISEFIPNSSKSGQSVLDMETTSHGGIPDSDLTPADTENLNLNNHTKTRINSVSKESCLENPGSASSRASSSLNERGSEWPMDVPMAASNEKSNHRLGCISNPSKSEQSALEAERTSLGGMPNMEFNPVKVDETLNSGNPNGNEDMSHTGSVEKENDPAIALGHSSNELDSFNGWDPEQIVEQIGQSTQYSFRGEGILQSSTMEITTDEPERASEQSTINEKSPEVLPLRSAVGIAVVPHCETEDLENNTDKMLIETSTDSSSPIKPQPVPIGIQAGFESKSGNTDITTHSPSEPDSSLETNSQDAATAQTTSKNEVVQAEDLPDKSEPAKQVDSDSQTSTGCFQNPEALLEEHESTTNETEPSNPPPMSGRNQTESVHNSMADGTQSIEPGSDLASAEPVIVAIDIKEDNVAADDGTNDEYPSDWASVSEEADEPGALIKLMSAAAPGEIHSDNPEPDKPATAQEQTIEQTGSGSDNNESLNPVMVNASASSEKVENRADETGSISGEADQSPRLNPAEKMELSAEIALTDGVQDGHSENANEGQILLLASAPSSENISSIEERPVEQHKSGTDAISELPSKQEVSEPVNSHRSHDEAEKM